MFVALIFAEFLHALICLLRNVPYMYCAGYKICVNIVIVGVLLNAVRYVEIAFYQPAFVASIISGMLLWYTSSSDRGKTRLS